MRVEAAAMGFVGALCPGAVPRPLLYDASNHVLAMPLVPPPHRPLLDAIRDGEVCVAARAAHVGRLRLSWASEPPTRVQLASPTRHEAKARRAASPQHSLGQPTACSHAPHAGASLRPPPQILPNLAQQLASLLAATYASSSLEAMGAEAHARAVEDFRNSDIVEANEQVGRRGLSVRHTEGPAVCGACAPWRMDRSTP